MGWFQIKINTFSMTSCPMTTLTTSYMMCLHLTQVGFELSYIMSMYTVQSVSLSTNLLYYIKRSQLFLNFKRGQLEVIVPSNL